MSTTASAAFAVIRARLDAMDSGISIPRYYIGDEPPILADTPSPFVFVVFTNDGSGQGPAAYGGGSGQNLYRNRASVEAYVFSPMVGDGLETVLNYAETVASRMRSFRDDSISCFSADVIPIGPGSNISVPGLSSEVSNYQCAVAECMLSFDQIG